MPLFPYTEKTLVKEISKILSEYDDAFRFEYNPATRTLSYTNSEKANTINLVNIYNKAKNLDKKDRKSFLYNFIGTAMGDRQYIPSDFVDSLTLRVRTPYEINHRMLQLQESFKEEKLNKSLEWILYGDGEILLELTSDSEDTVMMVTSEILEDHELSREEAYKIAAAKLYRHTDEFQWQQIDEAIWASNYQDDYDFARLLANPQANRFPFDGQPIIYAPSHSICLVTNRADEAVLNKMVNYGYEAAQDHRPSTQFLWTITSDFQFVPWMPSQDSACYKIARSQMLGETLSRYNEQKEFIKKMIAEEGNDIFVGSFQVFEKDQIIYSVCTYSLDIISYLPKTDMVAIADPYEPDEASMLQGIMTWETFAEVMGNELTKLPNLIPEHYGVLAPLSDHAKQKLKKPSVDNISTH